MELIRDNDKKRIIIKNKNNLLFEMDFIGNEFAFILYGNEPIIIDENLDEVFYKNLKVIMNNDYIFEDNNSCKQDNLLIWLSDEDIDQNNKDVVDEINRLIIEEKNNNIIIYSNNPYFTKKNYKKEYNLILFSPTEIGKNTKNLNSGSTFQKDIIEMFNKTYENKLTNKEKVRVR